MINKECLASLKLDQLTEAVLQWWNKHQYDTESFLVDGWAESDFIYDGLPEFVRLAEEIRSWQGRLEGEGKRETA